VMGRHQSRAADLRAGRDDSRSRCDLVVRTPASLAPAGRRRAPRLERASGRRHGRPACRLAFSEARVGRGWFQRQKEVTSWDRCWRTRAWH
jgi:hypothetical protein